MSKPANAYICSPRKYRFWGGANGGDGEAPCAERQRVPLVQAVREIVATTLVMAVMAAAGWFIGGAIGGLTAAGGTSARLFLRELMAGMGLMALAVPATAGTVDCNPIPVPPRGGDAIHDQCADSIPFNEYRGLDVCMSKGTLTKRYDGQSGQILWEVKTYNMNNQNPPYFLLSTKDVPNAEAVASPVARGCGYAYKWWVGDPRIIPALETVFPGFVPKVADGIEVAQSGCIQPDK